MPAVSQAMIWVWLIWVFWSIWVWSIWAWPVRVWAAGLLSTEAAAAMATKSANNENNRDFSFTGLPYRGLACWWRCFGYLERLWQP